MLFLFQVVTCIETALTSAQEIIENHDLYVLHHNAFGKGDVKRIGVSPDGFIQLALQLAYYKVE